MPTLTSAVVLRGAGAMKAVIQDQRDRHAQDQSHEHDGFDALGVPLEGRPSTGQLRGEQQESPDARNQTDNEERLYDQGALLDSGANGMQQLGNDEQQQALVQDVRQDDER